MSKELIAAIRKRREVTIEVGAWKFFARRPNDVEAIALSDSNHVYADMAMKFVIGWEGITENDLIAGGGSDEIPFTPELWAEFCADHSELWIPIGGRLHEAYKLHGESREQVGKN